MRARVLLHPNVWLPVVAIGAASWIYTLMVFTFLDGKAPREARPDFLIVGVLMIAAIAGAHVIVYDAIRKCSMLAAAGVTAFFVILPFPLDVWYAESVTALAQTLRSSMPFVLGDIAASFLVYLSYSKAVPSVFALLIPPESPSVFWKARSTRTS